MRALHVTPFHGMTDILLRCKQVAVINILEPSERGGAPATIPCSSLKLSMALAFFAFYQGGLVVLPDRSSIDIQPFVFGGEDVRLCSASQSSSNPSIEFQWVTEPGIPWDWGEDCTACSMYRAIRNHRIVPAYTWKTGGYRSQINTLLPNVMSVKVVVDGT